MEYNDIAMFAEIDREAMKALPIALNTVGQSQEQGPIIRNEGMNYHEFIWVTNGSGYFSVDGDSFYLETGEGVFIRAGTPHSYHGDHFSTSWFTFSMTESILDHLNVGSYLRFSVPAFLEAENNALERFSCGESTIFSRSANTYTLITELFAAVLPSSDSLEVRVRRYLESHYSEPLTLDIIARFAGTDRFTICHYYAKKRGISVMEELNSIRIAKAKRFLRYTTDPVESIGKMCGFDSASYFAKRFRQLCGQSPSEYRKIKLKRQSSL